jgi:hypothetical protein
LLEARQEAESPKRSEAERDILQSIERASVERDRLEDLYAPYGVIAEPTVENGFTVNLILAFGNVDSRRSSRTEPIRFAAHLPIPIPGD